MFVPFFPPLLHMYQTQTEFYHRSGSYITCGWIKCRLDPESMKTQHLILKKEKHNTQISTTQVQVQQSDFYGRTHTKVNQSVLLLLKIDKFIAITTQNACCIYFQKYYTICLSYCITVAYYLLFAYAADDKVTQPPTFLVNRKPVRE